VVRRAAPRERRGRVRAPAWAPSSRLPGQRADQSDAAPAWSGYVLEQQGGCSAERGCSYVFKCYLKATRAMAEAKLYIISSKNAKIIINSLKREPGPLRPLKTAENSDFPPTAIPPRTSLFSSPTTYGPAGGASVGPRRTGPQ
jgi:hypothetical protein